MMTKRKLQFFFFGKVKYRLFLFIHKWTFASQSVIWCSIYLWLSLEAASDIIFMFHFIFFLIYSAPSKSIVMLPFSLKRDFMVTNWWFKHHILYAGHCSNIIGQRRNEICNTNLHQSSGMITISLLIWWVKSSWW